MGGKTDNHVSRRSLIRCSLFLSLFLSSSQMSYLINYHLSSLSLKSRSKCFFKRYKGDVIYLMNIGKNEYIEREIYYIYIKLGTLFTNRLNDAEEGEGGRRGTIQWNTCASFEHDRSIRHAFVKLTQSIVSNNQNLTFSLTKNNVRFSLLKSLVKFFNYQTVATIILNLICKIEQSFLIKFSL